MLCSQRLFLPRMASFPIQPGLLPAHSAQFAPEDGFYPRGQRMLAYRNPSTYPLGIRALTGRSDSSNTLLPLNLTAPRFPGPCPVTLGSLWSLAPSVGTGAVPVTAVPAGACPGLITLVITGRVSGLGFHRIFSCQ